LFESLKEQTTFLYITAFRPALRPAQTPIQWVPEALSQGIRPPEREADDLLSSSADVENRTAISSLLPAIFMAGSSIN
jgi:hypothetical protein